MLVGLTASEETASRSAKKTVYPCTPCRNRFLATLPVLRTVLHWPEEAVWWRFAV